VQNTCQVGLRGRIGLSMLLVERGVFVLGEEIAAHAGDLVFDRAPT